MPLFRLFWAWLPQEKTNSADKNDAGAAKPKGRAAPATYGRANYESAFILWGKLPNAMPVPAHHCAKGRKEGRIRLLSLFDGQEIGEAGDVKDFLHRLIGVRDFHLAFSAHGPVRGQHHPESGRNYTLAGCSKAWR